MCTSKRGEGESAGCEEMEEVSSYTHLVIAFAELCNVLVIGK